MKTIQILLSILLFVLFFSSCKQGPKIISTPIEQSVRADVKSAKTIFSDGDSPETLDKTIQGEELHIVETLESMDAARYVYVKVREDKEEYWVATAKKEIEIGKTYFFKKGLEKRNFKSEEIDKTFDKLYLISNLVPADHGGSKIQKLDNSASQSAPITSRNKIQVEGSISIAEIVNNPEKYKNKEVQISGKCTKVNYNILGRNWIHMKDGSKDDFDLVLTSNDEVQLNQNVTMKGVVHLGVDFGAGYTYDIIIEEAKVVKQD